MATLHKRRATASLVCSLLVTMSAPAQAAGEGLEERRMQAQTLYDQGLELESDDPRAALDAFRTSYEIDANFRALYKIGRVCLKLGDKGCAARSFEQYLNEGRGHISRSGWRDTR